MSGNLNLPISRLQEKRFDINEIKDRYFSVDPFDVEDNLMYFPIALFSNSNYVSRKINLRNLLRTYSFSQQFIVDLHEILLMNDLAYDLYYGDTKLNVVDGKITIPVGSLGDFYTKEEIDSKLTTINSNITTINNKLTSVINIRYSYNIQFYHTNNTYTLLVNNQVVNGAISETIEHGDIITKVTLQHPLNLSILNNQMPNVMVYENKMINENFVSFNDCATNYIENTFVDIMIRKNLTIEDNTLKIELIFGNTRCFKGKIQIS